VQQISQYDTVLYKYFDHTNENDICNYYLQQEKQNKLIGLMANKVTETAVNKIRYIKYLATLLDRTTATGHVEQMTIILRHTDTNKG
jgi:hypothetical protein